MLDVAGYVVAGTYSALAAQLSLVAKPAVNSLKLERTRAFHLPDAEPDASEDRHGRENHATRAAVGGRGSADLIRDVAGTAGTHSSRCAHSEFVVQLANVAQIGVD